MDRGVRWEPPSRRGLVGIRHRSRVRRLGSAPQRDWERNGGVHGVHAALAIYPDGARVTLVTDSQSTAGILKSLADYRSGNSAAPRLGRLAAGVPDPVMQLALHHVRRLDLAVEWTLGTRIHCRLRRISCAPLPGLPKTTPRRATERCDSAVPVVAKAAGSLPGGSEANGLWSPRTNPLQLSPW